MKIEYTPESGGIELEFESKNGLKGYLQTTVSENKTIGLDTDLGSLKKRTEYVEHAQNLYAEALTHINLDKALNELSIFANEQLEIAMKKREEAAEAVKEESGDACYENAPEEGSERHKKALELLKAEDILETVAHDMNKLGHIGEWTNKKLAFLCAISARAHLPVQPSTHAESSAGKNYLWDTVLSLLPEELVFKRTSFSAKALFRTSMSLKHSVLYIQEVVGSEGADFSIRTLQSDGVLRWEATEKLPDGTLGNVEYEVEGPCVVVQTTTRNHLHPENETRVLPIYLDESAEQTERITKDVLRRAEGDENLSNNQREALCEKWRDAIRLLEPATVVLPFAQRIQVPSAPVRLRRDVPRLLNLIRLVAWVHQHNRDWDDQGRIIATEKDFDESITLVGESFARAWKSLSPSEEKIYTASKKLPENLRKHGFKFSHVEKIFSKEGEKIGSSTVKNALTSLASSGYLESDGKRGAGGATYKVVNKVGISRTITLGELRHSDIKEHLEETPVKGHKIMSEDESRHSQTLDIQDEETKNESVMSGMSENVSNGSQTLKEGDLQEKPDNVSMSEGNGQKEKEKEAVQDDGYFYITKN